MGGGKARRWGGGFVVYVRFSVSLYLVLSQWMSFHLILKFYATYRERIWFMGALAVQSVCYTDLRLTVYEQFLRVASRAKTNTCHEGQLSFGSNVQLLSDTFLHCCTRLNVLDAGLYLRVCFIVRFTDQSEFIHKETQSQSADTKATYVTSWQEGPSVYTYPTWTLPHCHIFEQFGRILFERCVT